MHQVRRGALAVAAAAIVGVPLPPLLVPTPTPRPRRPSGHGGNGRRWRGTGLRTEPATSTAHHAQAPAPGRRTSAAWPEQARGCLRTARPRCSTASVKASNRAAAGRRWACRAPYRQRSSSSWERNARPPAQAPAPISAPCFPRAAVVVVVVGGGGGLVTGGPVLPLRLWVGRRARGRGAECGRRRGRHGMGRVREAGRMQC
jgi:hypothetical protein